MPGDKVILVSGALANKYANGGEAWVRLSWLRGLRRLGFDVYFVEQITPAACVGPDGRPAEFERSVNREWFCAVTSEFGLAERSALILADGAPDDGEPLTEGLAWDRVIDVARAAELLVNISGHLTLPSLTEQVRRKAYIDIDPGYTQIWHADPRVAFRVAPHDAYYTIGENIGKAVCPIPTGGLRWRPTRQPVVLEDWTTETPPAEAGRFTTVASWRGAFGPVELGGKTYGVKAHEFRKVFELPRLVENATFQIALDIHSDDVRDSAALAEHGWRMVDPRAASGTPNAFRSYVQQSAAEFSVAQGVYVGTNSGWFSDRTVRYLASGRPVLVQETGFSENLAGTGEGIVPFRSLEEAREGAEHILKHYRDHADAARAAATRHFESDRVLGRLIEDLGVRP